MANKTGGSIYQRGKIWWVKYYRNGRPFRESSKSENKSDAKTLLARRLGEKADGKPVVLRRNVTVEELLRDVLLDYETNNRKSASMQKQRIEKHLIPYFGHWQASAISGADVQTYIKKRQEGEPKTETTKGKPPAKNATINRELSALQRAFTLGNRNGKLQHAPYFQMLEENNARQGFFEEDKYQTVRQNLPVHLQPVADFANLTGWRKGEILSLEWREVDLQAGCIRLDAQKTKNNTARTIYMTRRLREVMEKQRAYTDAVQKARGMIIAYVFHKNGEPINSFYKAWRTACKKAGVPGMLLHDFRRTHVRRLVRAGVPEKVAMEETGHRSRSVFERYNIVSDADHREAVRRLEEAERAQNGHSGAVSSVPVPANSLKIQG